MKGFNPKVSIIIPVYNGSNYLKEAIDSALAQTYKNIEVIVVNDGSSDKGATEKIAKSYGKKIKYFRKENGGVATALNLGIEKMTGEYFSWLSHDDLYYPERTQKMIQRISVEVDKKNLIIATSCVYFNRSAKFSPVRTEKYIPSHPLSYLFLGYINGCSILIPKSIFLKDGVFNENLPTTQDFDLWFRLLRNNRLIYLNEELTLSRSHDEQGSKVMLTEHIKECNSLWIGMMKALRSSEKSRIFDNELKFYNLIYDFLKNNTLYDDAISFAHQQVLKIAKQRLYDEGLKPFFIEELTIRTRKDRRTIFFPIFGSYSDRGGLNKMISMLANRLSENYNIIIASYTASEGGYHLNKDISYIRVSTESSGVDSFMAISEIFDIDIMVVSHNCSTQALDLMSRVKAINKKVIAWNHEDFFHPYSIPSLSGVWPIRNEVFAKVDAVLWQTNASCAAYSLSNGNGLVMPNFVHFENTPATGLVEAIYKNIISVARFDDPTKRINKLLESYEKIIAQRPEIKLTIVGSVDMDMDYEKNESVGSAIERINSREKHISLAGFVDDVENYYSKSDIQILPSSHEGFGLTILEGAHLGVPTVVFDNSGFEDVINDGVDGVIVPEADTDILAQRVIELFDNERKLIKMKRLSKKIINKFDEDKSINAWGILIENILDSKSIMFNRYDYDSPFVLRIPSSFESSLAELSDRINRSEGCWATPQALPPSNRSEGLLNTRSWRYTRPLRLCTDIYRSIRARL